MTDDRDRRAAAEFRALNLTPLFVEAEVGADFVVDFDRQLAAFRAAARAEGAATLKAAARDVVEAGDIVDDCYPEERKLRAALDALRAALEGSP